MLKLEEQGVLKSFVLEAKRRSGGGASSRRRPMGIATWFYRNFPKNLHF